MIRKLDWDSSFFKIDVGECVYDSELQTQQNDDFDLLYIKSDHDFDLVLSGYTNSFSETKLVYGKKITDNQLTNNKIISANVFKYNLNDIYNLAYESGKHSRFLADKCFESGKFEELYHKWVDNSLDHTFADDVFLYVENDHVLGFVTFKTHHKNATIGLLAVDTTHQGKGIGCALLQYVELVLYSKNILTLQIPTQEANKQACEFYKKQGYSIHQTTFIKHFWKNT